MEFPFCMSIRTLTDPANLHWLAFRNSTLNIPVFKGGPRDVWGLTAFFLHTFLKNVVQAPMLDGPADPSTVSRM